MGGSSSEFQKGNWVGIGGTPSAANEYSSIGSERHIKLRVGGVVSVLLSALRMMNDKMNSRNGLNISRRQHQVGRRGASIIGRHKLRAVKFDDFVDICF